MSTSETFKTENIMKTLNTILYDGFYCYQITMIHLLQDYNSQ